MAPSSAELAYFELGLDGQLNEYQYRKAMGSNKRGHNLHRRLGYAHALPRLHNNFMIS